MNKIIKILHTEWSDGWGGQEIRILSESKAFIEKGYEMIIAAQPNSELFKQDHVLDSNIKLRVCIRNGIYYQELVRVLIGVCGLQVNIDSVDERGEVVLEISGDVVSEDIRLAVNMLVPHMDELLDFSAEFTEGIYGIMQIITVMEIDEALKRRRL